MLGKPVLSGGCAEDGLIEKSERVSSLVRRTSSRKMGQCIVCW